MLLLGSCGNRLERALEVLDDLTRGLRTRIRATKGMEGQRPCLHVTAREVLDVLPALHLLLMPGEPRLDFQRLGLAVEPRLERLQAVLHLAQVLVRLANSLSHSECIAFTQIMDAVEEIRHTQACEASFGQLNQGLGTITHHIPSRCPKRLETIFYDRLPGGKRAIRSDLLLTRDNMSD